MNIKLIGKIIITGKLKAVTGVHIGGSKTALDIGGVDLNVIKTPQGVPFIPGSSLKGKLRSLLGKISACVSVKDDAKFIKELFGASGDEQNVGKEMTATRLLVRDAFAILNKENSKKYEGELANSDVELELGYTEIKWENTINRLTGTAKDPRQLERVPAGAFFKFELVYDVYDDAFEKAEDIVGERKRTGIRIEEHLKGLALAMRLLADDYLGGQGSRGYGKVEFAEVGAKYLAINDETFAYEPNSGNETVNAMLPLFEAEALKKTEEGK
jgi:CRISPR-associated protein Csm3